VLTVGVVRVVPVAVVVRVVTHIGRAILRRGGGAVHGLPPTSGGSGVGHGRLAPVVGVRVEAVGVRAPIPRGLAVPCGVGSFLPGHGLLAVGPTHALLRLGLPAIGLCGVHLGLLPVLVRFLAPVLHLASTRPLGKHREQHDAQQHGETDDDHDCDVHLYENLLV